MTSQKSPVKPFAPPQVLVEKRSDGAMVLRSPQELRPYARSLGEWLVRWAQEAPERVFLGERLGERQGDALRQVTYREALAQVRRIAASLLARGLDAGRPVIVLSDNGVDHALLALGAMHVGIPVVPVSPAYSLMSRDFARLRYIFELAQPGLVYAADPERFGPALRAVGASATPISELLTTEPDSAVDAAFASVGPETVAKILFTSGSTGAPKGVVNTQRMLCASQEGLAQGWPFLETKPPVLVDWLPWNHTFGGNHDFNLVLRNGGTLFIDGGKPLPGLVELTVRNLKEISPTIYFNVPRGFDLLLPYLESDSALARSFFRRLDVLFYAGAALPQNLWERIEALSRRQSDGRLAMLSAWGSTETSPLATQVHFPIDRAGIIGLPIPGCEIKLVPSGSKLEARVRGPNVTPGYFKRDDLTAAAFDEEGFYRIGDALRFADPQEPNKGLVFDGRVAEDFKLTTGTWVSAGVVRVRLIAAGNPLIQDAVITGHDRDEVGALLFLSAAAKDLSEGELRQRLGSVLTALAQEATSSLCPKRLLILREPPSIDANEITDKGYLNQRAVLERRADQVALLYSEEASVIRA